MHTQDKQLLTCPDATFYVPPAQILLRRSSRLSFGFLSLFAILLFAFSPIDAAGNNCKPRKQVRSTEYGNVTLHVGYQPPVILEGENFLLNVRIEYIPSDPSAQDHYFQIQGVQFFHGALISYLSDLGPQMFKEEGKLITTNSYTFHVSADETPGNKEGAVNIQMGDHPILKERFCVPVGSEAEKYLTVTAKPSLLSLTWGESTEFVLDLENTYPYTYAVTDVKVMPHANAPYRLQLLTNLPVVVKRRDSSIGIKVTALFPWTALLDVSNAPIEAELRVTYKDPYERKVEEKTVEVKLIILPPIWVLWLLAIIGGVGGGVLRYTAGRHGDPKPILWRELGIGVLAAVVLYVVFQLGDISIVLHNLHLSVDNNTGVVALFIGLMAGWRGKGVLERLT